MHKLLAALLLLVPSLAPAQLTPTQAAAETVQFTRDLIRIDTQDPPGNESKVANYLAAIFKKENIAYELLETVPGRASLLARIPGDGSKKPILLMAHEDVVPVDRAHWTVDPFAGVTKGGVLYGRGASDDKSPLAANLETMLQIHRAGKTLKRDVLFLAEASEETASPAGMGTLVERFWPKLQCEFALNEGGAAEVIEGKIPYIGVATAEKMPRGVRLLAKGSSGHASVPLEDNAIVHLARAVARIGEWEPPMRLNDATRTFFERLATISPPDRAQIYRTLDTPASQAALRKQEPQFYSMLRTSAVPTILKGGFKSNVIPTDAEATIDIRALPDENLDAFYAQMEKIIDDPTVTIERPSLANTMPPAPASSIHTDMFTALEQAQKVVYPGAITTPMMTTGATDSSWLRTKGVNAYGIRVPRTFAENTAVHGNDERIGEQYVALYQQFTYQAVLLVSQ